MIEITAEIRALIDKAAVGMELAGDEYIDPADGLIHCKKCGGQRQTVVPCFGKSGYFMPRCICQCQREAEEQRKAAEERQRRMELFQIIVPYLPPPRNPQSKKAPPSEFFHRGQRSIRTNISSRTSIHQTHRSTVPQCSLNGFPEHLQLRSTFWQESSSYCWPRYSLPLP